VAVRIGAYQAINARGEIDINLADTVVFVLVLAATILVCRVLEIHFIHIFKLWEYTDRTVLVLHLAGSIGGNRYCHWLVWWGHATAAGFDLTKVHGR
jgi:hypothetical protein